MTQRGIIGKISLVTITSFLVFFLVLFKVDPESAGSLEFFAFYISMFLALWGLFFLIGFSYQSSRKKVDELTVYQTALHGGLLASLMFGLVVLQHLGYATILNISILVVLTVVLEVILSRR